MKVEVKTSVPILWLASVEMFSVAVCLRGGAGISSPYFFLIKGAENIDVLVI